MHTVLYLAYSDPI